MSRSTGRVCHLTSVHAALDDRIFFRECRTLVQAGYEVTLIAPAEADQEVNGVQIRAVPKPKRRLDRMTKTAWAVYRAAVRQNSNVYHFHDPELIPIAFLLRLKGKRVIYDVHEDLPDDVLTKDWIPRPLRGLVAWLANALSHFAGAIFTKIIPATSNISKRFPPSKCVIVRNYPVLDELAYGDLPNFDRRPDNVVYLGSITRIRGIHQMVQAMSVPSVPKNARLILAGVFDGRALETEVRENPSWRRVEFMGWQPRSSLRAILSSAKAGLILLHPELPFLEALPAKLFEYMAAGVPVVASDFPLWRKIIEEVGCGILVDPLDVDAIGRAIAYLLQHPFESEAMGKRGRQAVLSKFNWSTQTEDFLNVYEAII